MNKKKLVSLCLVLALVLTAVIGGTMAYFTDEDSATNTFTSGNVNITLIEQERVTDEEGKTTLGNFSQEKPLYPIVGSAQGEKDEFGLPTAANYVDKVVTVKNEGTNGAWVRAYFAIPSALDDGPETFNASLNVLHFNFGNHNGATTYENQWKWKTADKWNCFVTTINEIKYNVYYADYYQVLGAGKTTERLLDGVYLDSSFDTKTDANGKIAYYAFGKQLTLDEKLDMTSVDCPVYVVAVQDKGFDSVAAAVDAAFGANFNPWAPAE